MKPPSNKHMLISSHHLVALLEGPPYQEKNNRVNEMELRNLEYMKASLVNHSHHPQTVAPCLEPVAFHKIVKDMLCISGDFPHS